MSNKNPLRPLKVKLANLQVEIQALLDKSDQEPGVVDAIASDIADFTDEITKIRKQISDLNDRKKQNESISLSEIYKEIKKERK